MIYLQNILVTGGCGFVGTHLAKFYADQGHNVLVFDNLSRINIFGHYLKNSKYNWDYLKNYDNITLMNIDITNSSLLTKNLMQDIDIILHTAGQTAVTTSVTNPKNDFMINTVGTFNILEGCRHNQVEHLVYASSSSVYGLNTKYPFSVHDKASHPASFYGATKISNELMAHSYSHLYKLPTTGLRFFTVYGPWGRPDMAYFLFTKSILASEPIDLYNQGNMTRDFTYIEDIVEGVCRIIQKIPEPNPNWSGLDPDPASSTAPYRLYNIGSNRPIQLMDYVQEIEKNLGVKAKLNLMPMQGGDVKKSHADVDDLVKDFEYSPKWNIQNGIRNFIQWYIHYYNVKLIK